MSKTINFEHRVGVTLTDVTSVVLRDPLNVFGVKRTDTHAIVVAAGVSFTHVSTGVYRYTFAEPAANLSYEYWVEYVFLGNTRRERQVLQGQSAPGVGSVVSVPTSAYVNLGVLSVSCGDTELEQFLQTHAPTIWAMQLRRGVVLDLRYQYFVLDLINLSLDHVRMLIDTEIGRQQTQETGYLNASSNNASNSASQHHALSISAQSATSAQNTIRSMVRSSSSETVSDSSQTQVGTNQTTDASTQTQAVINRQSGSNDMIVKQSPLPSGAFSNVTEQSGITRQYRNSHMHSTSTMTVDEAMVRWNISVPVVGSLSGQNGALVGPPGLAKSISPDESNSSTSLTAYDKQDQDQRRRRKVATTTSTGGTTGVATQDATSNGVGTRTNNIHRTSHSEMTGASLSTSVGSMISTAHDESHGVGDSQAQSNMLGSAMSSASSLSHRESTGATQAQGEMTLNRQYYDQIFQSLQQMWKDTTEQIKRLEQQVQISSRYLIQKLQVSTPQNTLTLSGVSGNKKQTPTTLQQINPYDLFTR